MSFYNTGLYNVKLVVVPLRFTSLIAWGKKPLCSLAVQEWILLCLLPDGSRVNTLWLGWVLSFSVLYSPQTPHLTDGTDAL